MVGAFLWILPRPAGEQGFPATRSRQPVVVLLAAMVLCAALGIIIEKLAYRPLRSRPKLTVLITAIGVSLFIEYVGQHPKVFGPSPQTFPDWSRAGIFSWRSCGEQHERSLFWR